MKKVKSSRPAIPVHRMDARTGIGIELHYQSLTNDAIAAHEPHRDDYYLFAFLERGYAKMMIDFEEMKIQGCSIFYVLPGQVHHMTIAKGTGWLMAIDASMISSEVRGFFEEQVLLQKSLSVNKSVATQLKACASLLKDHLKQDLSALRKEIITQLAGAFVGMLTDCYQQQHPEPKNLSRTLIITRQFKALLPAKFKSMKSPAEYAALMNYSLAHLNESVKTITGFTVSYWIQHYAITEAKRLLYHSPLSVKEIASELGYEDSAYFSRLFSKMSGIAPGSFRTKFRE